MLVGRPISSHASRKLVPDFSRESNGMDMCGTSQPVTHNHKL